VAPGQTLFRIARTYGVSVETLAAANDITDPTAVRVGTELVVPGAAGIREVVPPGAQEAGPPAPPSAAAGRVTDGTPTGSAAATPGAPTLPSNSPATTRAARGRRTAALPRGSGVLGWPFRGVLYARFGSKGRERHDGIDLAAPAGTPVRTARAGTVLYAGEQKGYGLIAVVDHGDGLMTLYAHNRDLRVKTGQRVRDEQVIATVGESGRTSGPHLHFEVREAGVPVDPLLYLGAPPERRALGRRPLDSR
jgi:lipoprotein NlpD